MDAWISRLQPRCCRGLQNYAQGIFPDDPVANRRAAASRDRLRRLGQGHVNVDKEMTLLRKGKGITNLNPRMAFVKKKRMV